jgi:hypothetical protein
MRQRLIISAAINCSRKTSKSRRLFGGGEELHFGIPASLTSEEKKRKKSFSIVLSCSLILGQRQADALRFVKRDQPAQANYLDSEQSLVISARNRWWLGFKNHNVPTPIVVICSEVDGVLQFNGFRTSHIGADYDTFQTVILTEYVGGRYTGPPEQGDPCHYSCHPR